MHTSRHLVVAVVLQPSRRIHRKPVSFELQGQAFHTVDAHDGASRNLADDIDGAELDDHLSEEFAQFQACQRRSEAEVRTMPER